jgi:hypothetical protein
MSITSAFRSHPASVGESYLQHMRMGATFGARMIGGGIACLVHAVFPFLFVRTGSECIRRLHDCMSARRPQRRSDAFGAQPPRIAG